MIKTYYCSLSDAIREGLKLRPQAQRLFVKGFDGVIRSCALGAAYEALTGETPLGGMDDWDAYKTVEIAFPYICIGHVPCPVNHCGCDESVEALTMHLNDDHQWTREQIADFVERFEESIGYVTLTETAVCPVVVSVAGVSA